MLQLPFLCQRCHLCLSQCSSDNVNLNASTFDTKPTFRWHWTRWLLSHQCLISVRRFLSALGKWFLPPKLVPTINNISIDLMDCRTVGCFLNLFQVLVEAYRFQSVLVWDRWSEWLSGLLFEFKIHMRLTCHTKVTCLWGYSTSTVITWVSVSLTAFILGCEILFDMPTHPRRICPLWAVVPVYLCPSGLQLVELPFLYCHFSASLKFDIMLLHFSFFSSVICWLYLTMWVLLWCLLYCKAPHSCDECSINQ